MAVSSPPLTLEAIMGAMKTLLAPISQRLQCLEEAVFSGKASEAGSTSTVTGFSAHSLKSRESDLMETEGFSPVKTRKKRPAPSRSPQGNRKTPRPPLTPKPVFSSSKQSFTQAAPSWSAIAAGHPPGSPKGPILAAPQVFTSPTPQGSAPTAPKASRIPPIFLRDAGKWHLVSQKANFTKARSVSDQIRIQPATVADFRSFTRFMEAEKKKKKKKSGKAAQCHRCQRFFHAQRNCTAEHRCVKCGEAHDTKECAKERKEPPKCANCNGPYTANYRGCPQFPKLQKTATPKTAAPKKAGAPKPTAAPRSSLPRQTPPPPKTNEAPKRPLISVKR
ncbi:hypothetical protein TcasGA2_TC002169 [Tribolium castaneum]|uniref:Nucleic-acid-binding protein from transposon X-element-like Protein n=1 Tax=Tribolium castaneum TaxID=7070 RepID=D7ELV1_TRICA|nr:hypothetical protein TcasGA2_TC002169 [Tribolium castaneum]